MARRPSLAVGQWLSQRAIALIVAAVWVCLVTYGSWVAPGDPTFGDSVGRALAPVGAVVTVGIPVAMIWYGERFYRVIGWLFLVIFAIIIPAIRLANS
jgi:hypothetical protein